MGYCTVDDVCSAFPQFERNAAGSITDDKVQGWIDGRKARMRSVLLARGTDPDAVALTPDQFSFLRELNREGAQADLADALQAGVTLQSGEMALGSRHRQSYERVLAEITGGLHDRLFRPEARTTEVRPILGGTAGAETDPAATPATQGQNKSFGKGQLF